MRWETLKNGALLAVAAESQFDAFLTVDKKLEFEQNLKSLPLPIVILDALTNSFETVQIFVPIVQRLLAAPLQKRLYVLESNGNVVELISPRK
jgi:hypothetical protein